MNQWIDPAKADFSLEVMVVGDESMVAIMIVDMLEDLGHRVVVTSGSMSKASKIVADASADSRYWTST
jgi:CheY-like chemotaxis protein